MEKLLRWKELNKLPKLRQKARLVKSKYVTVFSPFYSDSLQHNPISICSEMCMKMLVGQVYCLHVTLIYYTFQITWYEHFALFFLAKESSMKFLPHMKKFINQIFMLVVMSFSIYSVHIWLIVNWIYTFDGARVEKIVSLCACRVVVGMWNCSICAYISRQELNEQKQTIGIMKSSAHRIGKKINAIVKFDFKEQGKKYRAKYESIWFRGKHREKWEGFMLASSSNCIWFNKEKTLTELSTFPLPV